ncbi:MAG TPA: acyl-CoA dehydrogenase family protein [Ilumatobacter sp.]|nr:acyl-CoA dehydrogenase family protein [Ilumatobacter sp.]
MELQELELVRTSLRHLLASTEPAQLPLALVEQGWDDLVAGDPDAVIAALFEEQGTARVAGPALDVVMLAAIGAVDPSTHALVVAPFQRDVTCSAVRRDGVLHVDGLALAGCDRADRFVIGDDSTVWTVACASVTVAPTGAFDPAFGLGRVTGVVPIESATAIAGAQEWCDAIAVGRRALASELIGIGQHVNTITVEYVGARVQYRRPIGSFQSVQHRLADAHIALCAARDAVITASEERDEWSAMTAKALAGRGVLQALANCFQVHGGIAFTDEHELHEYFERATMLDSLLGGHRDLAWAIGSQLLTEMALPRIPRL